MSFIHFQQLLYPGPDESGTLCSMSEYRKQSITGHAPTHTLTYTHNHSHLQVHSHNHSYTNQFIHFYLHVFGKWKRKQKTQRKPTQIWGGHAQKSVQTINRAQSAGVAVTSWVG